MTKDLLRSSAKAMMMKVVLCYLAMDDTVGGDKYLNKYSIDDPAFGQSREGSMLSTLVEARKNNDQDSFMNATSEYNRITPFQKIENYLVKAISEKFDAPSGNVIDPAGLGNDDDIQFDEDGGIDLT